MRTLFLLSFLFIQSALFAQIKFTIDAQDDGVTYLVKLMPEASYASPMNITNTAQISFVVQTGGLQLEIFKISKETGKMIIISSPQKAIHQRIMLSSI